MHSVYFLGVLSLVSTSVIVNGFLGPTFLSSKVAVSSRNTIEVRVYGSGKEENGDEDLFLAIQDTRQEENDSDCKMFQGAGKPRPELKPEEIVPLLMTALQKNDFPEEDAGLMSMWEFASDTTRFIFKNNITEFIESCHETADEFPTSFYGAAMNGQSWNLESELNRVGGNDGWIATHVMKTISSDGRLRRWQWELRKKRRPPCLGGWFVELIGSSDRNGDFEASDRGDGWSD